jgi:hypothetical protein
MKSVATLSYLRTVDGDPVLQPLRQVRGAEIEASFTAP